jgi:hypothetical protein
VKSVQQGNFWDYIKKSNKKFDLIFFFIKKRSNKWAPRAGTSGFR